MIGSFCQFPNQSFHTIRVSSAKGQPHNFTPDAAVTLQVCLGERKTKLMRSPAHGMLWKEYSVLAAYYVTFKAVSFDQAA